MDGAGSVGLMELVLLGRWSWFCWVDGAGSVGWMEPVLVLNTYQEFKFNTNIGVGVVLCMYEQLHKHFTLSTTL